MPSFSLKADVASAVAMSTLAGPTWPPIWTVLGAASFVASHLSPASDCVRSAVSRSPAVELERRRVRSCGRGRLVRTAAPAEENEDGERDRRIGRRQSDIEVTLPDRAGSGERAERATSSRSRGRSACPCGRSSRRRVLALDRALRLARNRAPGTRYDDRDRATAPSPSRRRATCRRGRASGKGAGPSRRRRDPRALRCGPAAARLGADHVALGDGVREVGRRREHEPGRLDRLARAGGGLAVDVRDGDELGPLLTTAVNAVPRLACSRNGP